MVSVEYQFGFPLNTGFLQSGQPAGKACLAMTMLSMNCECTICVSASQESGAMSHQILKESPAFYIIMYQLNARFACTVSRSVYVVHVGFNSFCMCCDMPTLGGSCSSVYIVLVTPPHRHAESLSDSRRHSRHMNHVKIFQGWPPRNAPSVLVQLWYKTFPQLWYKTFEDQRGLFEMKTPTGLSNKTSNS